MMASNSTVEANRGDKVWRAIIALAGDKIKHMSQYNEKQMVKMLKGFRGHLLEQADTYPSVNAIVAAIDAAMENPKASAVATKATANPKKQAQPAQNAKPPVTISYQGSDIVVEGTSGYGFWKPYYAMNKIMGVLTGKTINKPGTEYHGKPIYKSSYDKNSKSHRLPAEKADEVVAYFKSENIPVTVNS